MNTNLPSFKKPPLVETALSVQFKPLERFGNAHLGIFWHRDLRTEYPKVMDAEPILPQIELFGGAAIRRPRLPSFRIVPSQGATRLQMVAENEQGMVQAQNGRLVYNWRKLTDGTYPRWHRVLPAFQEALTRLEGYLATEGLGTIEPTLWEVTYVNHLRRGQEWQEMQDVVRVLPGLIGRTAGTSVGLPESLGCNWTFTLPEDRGRLHVELSHGFAAADPEPQEVLVLQLTARGNVTATCSLLDGMAKGRAAIVRMFTEVTGPEAHAAWEREK